MSYEDLCKSLGIDREAIAKQCENPNSTAVGQEKEYLKQNIGPMGNAR